jgi:hypothetical protein
VLHPLLSVGTPYWIVADAAIITGASNIQMLWGHNPIGEQGPTVFCDFCSLNGPWILNAAGLSRDVFQINGEPAPEPGSAVLAISGLVVGFFAAHRRRRERRPS